MRDKLIETFDYWEYHDLKMVEKDLNSGGKIISKVIADLIREVEELNAEICSTCGGIVTPDSKNSFTIIFGAEDIRKRASFCAKDCLEYFVKNLQSEKLKKGVTE